MGRKKQTTMTWPIPRKVPAVALVLVGSPLLRVCRRQRKFPRPSTTTVRSSRASNSPYTRYHREVLGLLRSILPWRLLHFGRRSALFLLRLSISSRSLSRATALLAPLLPGCNRSLVYLPCRTPLTWVFVSALWTQCTQGREVVRSPMGNHHNG